MSPVETFPLAEVAKGLGRSPRWLTDLVRSDPAIKCVRAGRGVYRFTVEQVAALHDYLSRRQHPTRLGAVPDPDERDARRASRALRRPA